MLVGSVLGLATDATWGTGDFLSRKPFKELGSYLSSILIQPIALVIMICVLLLSLVQNYIMIIVSHPLYLVADLAVGAVAFFGVIFIFRGYSLGVMSVVPRSVGRIL